MEDYCYTWQFKLERTSRIQPPGEMVSSMTVCHCAKHLKRLGLKQNPRLEVFYISLYL